MKLRIISTGGVEVYVHIKASAEDQAVALVLHAWDPPSGVHGVLEPLIIPAEWVDEAGYSYVGLRADDTSRINPPAHEPAPGRTEDLIINPANTFLVQVIR